MLDDDEVQFEGFDYSPRYLRHIHPTLFASLKACPPPPQIKFINLYYGQDHNYHRGRGHHLLPQSV